MPRTRVRTVRSVVFMLPWHERYKINTFIEFPSVRHSFTHYVSSPKILNVFLMKFYIGKGFQNKDIHLKTLYIFMQAEPVFISRHVH